ncbi:MAG: hypothetical protein JRG89_08820 [Deltaproteobacteria bacterium]|nr:hypothetical protein [Deltaproteobacteria bacterium]
MRSHARELCDRHGYPAELAEVLEEFVELALTHLGDIYSIVLSPSISTGDFLWRRDGAEVRLLSDIDGFIYLQGSLKGSAQDLAGYVAAVQRLSEEISEEIAGPMFHIDLSVSSMQTLDQLPQTYQFVETGCAGFVLYGEPVLDRFPTKFDPRASRQAFLLNLWKPLRHAFLSSDPDPTAAAQAAARLILDIPILAASESGECIAGHRERVRWFLAERPTLLGRDDEIRAAVMAAKTAREEPPGSVAELAPLLHIAIPRVVSLLDQRGEPASDFGAAIVERLAQWLPPRTPRRFLGECASVLRRPTNPVADLRWLHHRKEASGGAALLALYHYVAQLAEAGVADPPEEIRTLLRNFARRECSNETGPAFVRSACEVYQQGLWELYPALHKVD